MTEQQPAEKKRRSLLGFYIGMGVAAVLLVGFCFAWTPLRVWYWERQVRSRGERPLPLRVEVLPSKRVYSLGEKIRIRIRLVNPTAKPVTVVVFEDRLNGRENWWPVGEEWEDVDKYVLPDGTTRNAWPSIGLPVTDDRAEFVTIRPREAYQEVHSMAAKTSGTWNYHVYFSVHQKKIYSGAYTIPPLDFDGYTKFWKAVHAKGYIEADQSPYLLMRVNPDAMLGVARPAEARIEVRRK